LQLGPNRFALEYQFEPGTARDGVTMEVPLALLHQVPGGALRMAGARVAEGEGEKRSSRRCPRLRHKLGALDEFCRSVRRRARAFRTRRSLSALARYVRAHFNFDVPMRRVPADSAPHT